MTQITEQSQQVSDHVSNGITKSATADGAIANTKERDRLAKEREHLTVADYPPGKAVLRKFVRDGKEYWIRGYEIFDPKKDHSTVKGCQPLKPKKKAKYEEVLVLRAGQEGKPLPMALNEIALPDMVIKSYRFDEVYEVLVGAPPAIVHKDKVWEADENALEVDVSEPEEEEEGKTKKAKGSTTSSAKSKKRAK